MQKGLHTIIVQRTKEKLLKEGWIVDDSYSNTILAVNEAGVSIDDVPDGHPDLVAVKGKEVLVVDVVIGTYASEMADKIRDYGKLGKVVFIMPTDSLTNVSFWSVGDIGTSLAEL